MLGWDREEEQDSGLHLQTFSGEWAGKANPWFPSLHRQSRSYLGVAHAGSSDQGLLDCVALLEHSLLLSSHAPVALDQELHHLQVSPESGMDQGTLPIFVQMIHLEKR